jgi:hypothetical protein
MTTNDEAVEEIKTKNQTVNSVPRGAVFPRRNVTKSLHCWRKYDVGYLGI